MNYDAPGQEPEVVAEELGEVGYFGQVDEEEESPDGEVASDSRGPDPVEAKEAPNPEEPSPSNGRDERGEGEVIDGIKVRRYKGSTRLPGISPQVWAVSTPETEEGDVQTLREEPNGGPGANSTDYGTHLRLLRREPV